MPDACHAGLFYSSMIRRQRMGNGYIINRGDESDPRSLKLYTRKHRFVQNEQKPGFPVERMRAATQMWQQRHPEARLRAAASTYNCMGLVFANRRTCIDPDQWNLIREDDGYRPLADNERPLPGDVVLYEDQHGLAHVAVITKAEPDPRSADWRIEVISQWGADGEFIHDMHDVPQMLGTPTQIWTERAVR